MLVSEKRHGNPFNYYDERKYFKLKSWQKAIIINSFFTGLGLLLAMINIKIYHITIPVNITPKVMLASYQIIGSIIANVFFKVNPSKDFARLSSGNYDFEI